MPFVVSGARVLRPERRYSSRERTSIQHFCTGWRSQNPTLSPIVALEGRGTGDRCRIGVKCQAGGVQATSVSDDIERFVRKHRPHGQLVGDATEPTLSGYQVTITCPCGVVFMRWVTAGEAAVDLAAPARRN